MKDKKIILIGPGASIIEYKEQILKYINNEKTYIISVNSSSIFNVDAIFFGNKKRFSEFTELNNVFNREPIYLLTSNIIDKSEYDNMWLFDYTQLVATDLTISDNSLLMLINILIKAGIKDIIIAGFDGFNINEEKNFYDINLEHLINKNNKTLLNNTIKEYLNFYKRKGIIIKSITPSKYIE